VVRSDRDVRPCLRGLPDDVIDVGMVAKEDDVTHRDVLGRSVADTRAPGQAVATSTDGLTAAEVAAARAENGTNSLPPAKRPGVAWRASRQLADPMLLLLMAAACLTIWSGDHADTAVILTVVVLNTSVGVSQELRAERAVAALRDLSAPHARVRRDGQDRLVAASEVVTGDRLLVDAGDVVAADAQVVEAQRLETDDSALTGESMAVGKAPGDELFAGTTAVRGRAVAVVTRTGAASALGRIAELVAASRPGPTPLQMRLARLARALTLAALAAATLVVVSGLLRGLALSELVVTASSLAVAAVPESLPAVLTLSLALGAHRMARRAAVARELRAVETLGSVTLLATDKTGTLTENRMVAEKVWTPEAEYVVTGPGYDPSGTVSVRSGTPGPGLARLLRDVALCNDAQIEPDPIRPGRWRPLGDPMEAALVTLAHRGGLDPLQAREGHPRVHEIPFDSDRAWMATGHDAGEAALVVVKGAPDVLLPAVAGSRDAVAARAWATERAVEGSRVLVILEGCAHPIGNDLPADLSLVGLVALNDPPRDDLVPVLRTLADAGIRVTMMTGDHPATAQAVGRRVGLLPADSTTTVRTGADLVGEVTPELAAAPVFARVRPEQKLALVRTWQEAGEVVAVTGDGVNDGPALRLADIGVAMGLGGTEVARQAADLVLTDDRLQTVVVAVEEGRRIHDNLRRYLRYALSGGFAEVLVMLLAPLAGFAVPLLPGQILWINMLTHGLPGVALGADPGSASAMRRPPIPRTQPLVDRTMAKQVLVTGLLLATVSVVAAAWARSMGQDWQTSMFLVLGAGQLGVALAVRARGAARHNPFLAVAVAAAALLQVLAVTFPPLRELLNTGPLPKEMWLGCLCLSIMPGLLTWLAGGRRP
jgi:Ca2+-transporting ATPase